MNTVLQLADAAGSYAETRCLRFTLVRDRYQPYASLSATVAAVHDRVPLSVTLTVGAYTVFSGIVRRTERFAEGGVQLLKITARSWSEALVRNQLLPGLRFDVTLASLMTDCQLPHMTYEAVPDPVSYVYIEDRTPMWDAVTALNFKLNGGVPFVRADNQLCVLPRSEESPILLPAARVLHDGQTGECAGLISRIEMADIDGNYGTYAMTNAEAEQRGIVRVQRMQYDRCYLRDPQQAMEFRIQMSNRRLRGRVIRYAGYCGEELEDYAGLGADFRAHVSRIVLHGDANGIVTEDSFWFDSFCNVPE